MTAALVTGGAGFIGSNLVDRLLADGHDVTVVDDLSSGSRANLEPAAAQHGDRLSVKVGDIGDVSTVGVVADAAPEVIFHLAAQIDVRISVSDPVRDARTNIIGLLNVLEGARSAQTRKVVFASSGGTIYGELEPSQLPASEACERHPMSPYGITKSAGTDYLETYRELHGIEGLSLALANVFGPRQDPHGEAGVVAIFAGRLLAGEPCTIYGTGEQTRDYVYVDDVVDAFARGATAGGGLVNVGTGVETSVNDLYATMAETLGVDGGPEYAPARTGELDRSALDPTLARTELGWEPAVDLADGSRRVLEWWRAHRT